MKEILIGVLFGALVFAGLYIAIDTAYDNYQTDCESKGGVVVYGHNSRNCWKDGGYIKAQ